MVGSNPAISLLIDCVFAIKDAGSDDGSQKTFNISSPVTFLADRVSVKAPNILADHSTGQSVGEWNRRTKIKQKLIVETKLELKTGATLMAALLLGPVFSFSCTATGANIKGVGILGDIEWDYAGPSTLRFEILPYGPYTNSGTKAIWEITTT